MKIKHLTPLWGLGLALLLSFGAMAQSSSGKVLRHVVMFKFKDGTTAEQVKKVEDAFRKLPTQIKEIKGFEWGTLSRQSIGSRLLDSKINYDSLLTW